MTGSGTISEHRAQPACSMSPWRGAVTAPAFQFFSQAAAKRPQMPRFKLQFSNAGYGI
jgi:hypothetical protein